MRLKRPWLSPTKPPQSDTSTARVVYLGATQHGTARKKVVTARSQHHVQCWRAVGAVAASHHTHPRRRSHLATELLKEPPLIPYATPRHSIDHAMPAQVPSSRLAARTRERPALRSDAAITAGGARRGGGRGGGSGGQERAWKLRGHAACSLPMVGVQLPGLTKIGTDGASRMGRTHGVQYL